MNDPLPQPEALIIPLPHDRRGAAEENAGRLVTNAIRRTEPPTVMPGLPDDPDFYKRVVQGNEFAAWILTDYESWHEFTWHSGVEHNASKELLDALHMSDAPEVLKMRYAPDLHTAVAKPVRLFWTEAKACLDVEKQAYEQYEKLVNQGEVLVMAFDVAKGRGKTRDPRWCFFEELELIDGEETVRPYSWPWPVENGWVHPRADQKHWLYHISQPGHKPMSGRPYKEVRLSCLRAWAELKPAIYKKFGVALP